MNQKGKTSETQFPTRQFTYDMDWLDTPPTKGMYLVSIGKKGVGSVWLIMAIRPVKQKAIRNYARYMIIVKPMPELRPLADWDQNPNYPSVWVKGEPAYSLVWHPRNRKS